MTAARRYARAAVASIPEGPWTEFTQRPSLGFLVLDGLLMRQISVGGRVRAELLGPGDVVRPWEQPSVDTLALPVTCEWRVLGGVKLALLDERLVPVLARWPSVFSELMGRAVRRSHRLALQLGIGELQGVDVRLEVMLWHLAERWGRVTLAGVVLPFPLTHQTLGRLVGAQRPSVTSALTALNERGAVRRLPDGTWLLATER